MTTIPDVEIEPKNFTKKIIDTLNYIESETDILFDFESLEGIFTWLETETASLPTEFYYVYSLNYSIEFELRYCACDGCRKIVHIGLLPTNSNSNEDMKQISQYMKKLLPDISIYTYDPKVGYQ